MKKIFCIMLILCLFFSACGKKADKNAVFFYYPRMEYTQNSTDSVITAEQRNEIAFNSYTNTLSVYLKGPTDITLENPFPEELEFVDAYITSQTIVIIVSNQLSKLVGTQLTLACISLAKTAMELTDTTSCQIRCQSATLDGKQSINIAMESILLVDEIPDETTVEP